MNIRVDLDYPIKDGTEVVFRSPVDCSQVTGLKVYYLESGITTSKEFAFADAHGNNVGDIDHLFAENVAVKVILDVTTGMAFVQNADTNAYLEGRFDEISDHSAIVPQTTGELISVSDSSNNRLRGLTLYGKTTQDGTPSPNAPIELVNAGDDGSIEVTITDGGDANIQSMVVSTPNGLPGIPVTTGGNYTDASGQQWTCDEIDLARGVYVQRVKSVVLDDTLDYGWLTLGSYSNGNKYASMVFTETAQSSAILCNCYEPSGWSNVPGKTYCSGHALVMVDNRFTDRATAIATITAMKPKFLYILANPIEKKLSAEELADYALLHTNKLNTSVYTNSNAGVKLEYVADTKTYIDNKFAELAAAIVANT